LFHRHARGLVLTEQGEMLYQAAHEVLMKLESVKHAPHRGQGPAVRARCASRRPSASARAGSPSACRSSSTSIPKSSSSCILANEELDLTLRQADCAIRLRQPQQPDLIQRRLFTVHFHLYAAPSYVNKHGKPRTIDDLDNHRIVTFGEPVPITSGGHELARDGRPARRLEKRPRRSRSTTSCRSRPQCSVGRASPCLPDYMVEKEAGLVQLMPETEVPSFDTYFCYPDAMKNPGQAARLPRLPDREGAELVILSGTALPGRRASVHTEQAMRASHRCNAKDPAC
jgi:DNA-binding transcriptional LysR family regulator